MHKPLDLSHFYDIAEGNEDFVKKLLLILQKNLNEYPPQMQSLFDKKSMLALRELAHKFKSCIAYTGADEFNKLLVDIETSEVDNLSEVQIGLLVRKASEQAQLLAKEVANLIKEKA